GGPPAGGPRPGAGAAPAGAATTRAGKCCPQPPGPWAPSPARHSRPACRSTGTGAQWYLPSARSRPESLSLGVVHVLPPSLERRRTTWPYSLLVPIRYRAPLYTNKLDHHCPLSVA